jgi:hypothetical protein
MLEFGNPEHIEMLQKGAISYQALKGKVRLRRKEGCENACEHCTIPSYYWECSGCFATGKSKEALIIKFEGIDRCKQCKFIIRD